ncbi:MAG: WYL domain-containing protein [Spirochaetales bacterium]|nr:WYL domain-containing protein [Spirochaetales bacterium]
MENILNAFPRNAWGLLCCLQKGCLFLYPLAIGLWASGTAAQERAGFPADTVQPVQLQEVMVVSGRSPSQKADKPLATIDHYLAQSLSLDMVRRGTYAWEPYLNGMASERSVTTIDGMRIYAACTDRMDPVTSYIEVTNLEEAVITSGQHGATGGATIAGGLDLRRKKSYFGEKEFRGTVLGGFESNNRQKIAGADFSYRSQKLYADIDLMYRDAGNYTSGSGRELLYSQFTKYNVSAITGYKISEHQQLEASVIYDHAVDVGYPALPMDVSSAKAAQAVLAKIAATLPDDSEQHLLHAISHIYRPAGRYGAYSCLPAIRQACWDEYEIEIGYRDQAGVASQRLIRPLAIMYSERVLTILAWCCLRDDFRMFRVDRIESLSGRGASFRPQRASLLRDYLVRLRDENSA